MPLPVLLDDALRRTADGSEIRLSLPWIRSLPIAGLRELTVTIDGAPVEVPEFSGRTDWWYIQDRVTIAAPPLAGTEHDVTVAFSLAIPYLAAGPDGPLTLPFRAGRRLAAVA